MYLVLILLVLIWVSKRNSQAIISSAAQSGGRYAPRQTLSLGGMNLNGNEFDNGTTPTVLASQWSGFDRGAGNIVFAIQGGEDGANPAQPQVGLAMTQVTTLPKFRMIGGGDPQRPPVVPVNVTSLNDKLRR